MSNRTRTNVPKILLIVEDDQPTDQVVAEAEHILGHWTAPPAPSLVVESTASVWTKPHAFEDYAMAWVWSANRDRASQARLAEVLAAIEEAHLPALLTRTDDTKPAGTVHQYGMILCPPSTDPAAACAMMQALQSQTPVIQDVRGELQALRHYQGGLADRIGRIDEELRLASQLQREFLPEALPSVGNIDFHVLWRPAGYVSGDIYDVTRLDENHIGFFVADAVGHGVPAALLTMFVKRSLRPKILDNNEPEGYRLAEPAEALSRLNHDLVARQTGNARFVTACYGVIDTSSRQVTLARAGHPYPMVLSSNEERRFIQPEGGLLGIFDQADYGQVTFDLRDNDRLLLYTDGFELAFPDEGFHCGQVEEDGHYTEQFEILATGEVLSRLSEIEGKVDQQTGSLNQQDDLTVLCLDAGVRGEALVDEPVAVSVAA